MPDVTVVLRFLGTLFLHALAVPLLFEFQKHIATKISASLSHDNLTETRFPQPYAVAPSKVNVDWLLSSFPTTMTYQLPCKKIVVVVSVAACLMLLTVSKERVKPIDDVRNEEAHSEHQAPSFEYMIPPPLSIVTAPLTTNRALVRSGANTPPPLDPFLPSGAIVKHKFHTNPSSLWTSPNPTALLANIECPTAESGVPHLLEKHDSDDNIDQRTSHIEAKYTYYATRCNRTEGIMWKHMTRPVMSEVTRRVVKLIASVSPLLLTPSERPLSILDWASGCGVGLLILQEALFNTTRAPSTGLGIELIPQAVQYAAQHFESSIGDQKTSLRGASSHQRRYCQADGTKLSWLPPHSFDIIVSFGGLLHLPTAVMCTTIASLVEKLSPGGIMWTGYVDNVSTAESLLQCDPFQNAPCHRCITPLGVNVTIIRENKWFVRSGMPKVYRKKRPVSIIWQRFDPPSNQRATHQHIATHGTHGTNRSQE